MRVRLRVGNVSADLDGMELTRRQVRALLFDLAGIAATLEPEAEQSAPVGFTAHLERLPEEMPSEPLEDED